MTAKPVVLFFCTHNAGRSLAAKVLLDHYAQGRVDVRSAGSEPADELNPSVAAVLKERGLDTSKELRKPITDDLAKIADVVVTMVAATPARSTRASGISTGNFKTPLGYP
jgi:protein-tyrosine-phosphatase